MKKRPILLSLLSIIAVLIALLIISQRFREYVTIMSLVAYTDLTRPNDPASRAIRNGPPEWGSVVSLTPAPFPKGSAETDIIAELQKAKYTPDTDKVFLSRASKTFPVDSQFFEKSVDGLPCSVHYEVIVRFDAKHHLLESWGIEDEAGCL